jgi:hypothetical protein
MEEKQTFYPSSVNINPVKCNSTDLIKDNCMYKENSKSGEIFQTSCKNEEQLSSDGLVSLLTTAYNEHHKIVLRPEDIWMAIMCQFTFFTNKYSTELQSVFVKHIDKKDLEITNDMSTNLSNMSVKMVDKMKEYFQDENLSHWILPDFSTTTYNDTTVFAILMMGTLKKYFNYSFTLSCGLPEVTLLGTVNDWIEVKNRALKLVQYEVPGTVYMSRWVELLIPVLNNFIESAKGSPDLEWWNKVCHKYSGGSGPSYLTGWVTVFNVFSNEGEWLGGKHNDTYRRIKDSEWPLVDTNDIACGFTVFNVNVDNNGDKFIGHMYAGCMGADVKNSDTIVPRLDYGVVREKNEES